MKSYESSTATLRAILAHPLLQREKVDETMDALAAANDEARDVNDTIQLGATVAQGDASIDDSELEAELEALVHEVELEKAQVKHDRLGDATLHAPTHSPYTNDQATESSVTQDQEKVAIPA